MNEPVLRAWLQDSVPPQTSYELRPGRWVTEPAWPSPDITTRSFGLRFPAEPTSSSSIVGLEAGAWCGFAVCGDFPPDQRREDALSLCATSEPLAEPLEFLGIPEVHLTLRVDQPQALVAVRLCDVRPGGASLLVSRGILNLTHRAGHDAPTPLIPGAPIAMTVKLNACGHLLPTGHRLRVSVSPIYWPWVWPSPELVSLTILDGRLDLPARMRASEPADLAPFLAPEHTPLLAHAVDGQPTSRRSLHHDLATGKHVLTWDHDLNRGVRRKLADGLEFGTHGSDSYSIVEGMPLSATARTRWSVFLGRGDWQTRLESNGTLSADAHNFHATSALTAYEGDERVFSRSWKFAVARNQV